MVLITGDVVIGLGCRDLKIAITKISFFWYVILIDLEIDNTPVINKNKIIIIVSQVISHIYLCNIIIISYTIPSYMFHN